MNPDEFGLWLKCREFFAFASSELAFAPTPLLLRFFSPEFPLSLVALPGGLPFPLRFSPLPPSSAGFDAVGVSVEFESTASCATGSGPPSFGGDPELPNILFSKPPWEEKLLLLLPATLLDSPCVSREETRRGREGGLEKGLKNCWCQGWTALCEVVLAVGGDTRPEQLEVRESKIRESVRP
jgi:hypothetical protein